VTTGAISCAKLQSNQLRIKSWFNLNLTFSFKPTLRFDFHLKPGSTLDFRGSDWFQTQV